MKERLSPNISKVRILIIDDNLQVSQAIRDFLVSRGLDVETAHNEKQSIYVLDLRSKSEELTVSTRLSKRISHASQ
jgi:PleD family two-component response regulator